MVSAYGREELVEQAEAEGVKGFLIKPVSPSSLLDAFLDAMGYSVERAVTKDGAAPVKDQLRGARLLLVEDNEIDQQVAQELLLQADIQVTIANDGKEGVDILTEQPEAFDSVLMDIQMPVLDGYAATREIRRHRRFKALPIIVMTANAMATDRNEALASGMNDHLAKPIDVAQLFDVLSRWVQLPHERRVCDSRNADASEITTNGASSLPILPGVDTRAGLARVGGRVSVYRKILQQFIHSQTDAPQRVRRALQGHEPNTARREAHT